MLLTNYHTHCEHCDGKGTASEYLLQGKQLQFSALGFSSHAPLPFEFECSISLSNMQAYVDNIQQLKQDSLAMDGPQVYLGLEIDYLPNCWGPADPLWDSYGLDYRIGAVHALREPNGDRPMLTVDGEPEDFRTLLSDVYDNNAQLMVQDYYERVAGLCRQGGFEILAHYDLIKKHNRSFHFFDASAAWYQELAIDTLDEVAKADVILEINTGGIARGATTDIYPAPFLLKEAFHKKIPVQINADAHHAKHLDFHFTESLALVKTAGYKSVKVLLDGVWQDTPIS